MVTSARNWKNKKDTGETEVTLPSGNVCLARRLQPEAFLSSGLIPDQLSAMITKAIRSKKGLPPQELDEMTKDPKKLTEAMRMMDQVLCYVVIEPPCEMPPACEAELPTERGSGKKCGKYFDDTPAHKDATHVEFHAYKEADRDPDILYADQVDINDRIFMFQWAVGGTADVESFREQLGAGMGGLSTGQAVAKKAKRPARSK
jgi:hypothetical protein